MGSARIDMQYTPRKPQQQTQWRKRRAEGEDTDGRPTETYSRKDKYQSWKNPSTREEAWDDVDDSDDYR